MTLKLIIVRILDSLTRFRKKFMALLDAAGLLAALAGFLLFIFHIGFEHETGDVLRIKHFYNIILWLLVLSNLAGLTLVKWKQRAMKVRLAELIMIPLILLILEARTGFTGLNLSQTALYIFLNRNTAVNAVLIYALLVEVSTNSLYFSNRNINPALLFAYSFLFVIFLGTGLLMLPNATYTGITLTNAFFTSTSAVCVTGLIVVDTATYFTPLGQVFIIILIQLGGLGIMTFTSFFGYFFKGGASFGNEFLLKELINEEKIGEIFNTLLKIIAITFSIEVIGALLIYYTVPSSLFPDHIQAVGFAAFHSISAFCNAGFSTLSGNLYQPGFREIYGLHYIIGFLIIIGGLGFPIVFNYARLFNHFLKNKYNHFSTKRKYIHVPKIILVNTRIVMITTLLLISGGFFFFMFSEYNHSLRDLPLAGKVAGAFFASVTARTAGFNTVDLTALAPVSVLFLMFLMWVGASPASTGGGIKTTTFAVAVMNFVSLARGKGRIETFGRELANESVRRAFAIIFLSILVIMTATLLLVISDGALGLTNTLFEVISAFGTVGLTLGVTAQLSSAGKWIIIFTMFLGRVGTLTLLVGFFRKIRSFQYHYPKESVMIN